MIVYMMFVDILSILAGILIAVFSKKSEDVVYTKLDKAGRITNIVLVPAYAALSLFAMGMGLFCYPGYDEGILNILGWIVTLFIPSAPLISFGCGLGFSVALRKKGKSKQSFAVQFIGFASFLLSFLMFYVFYGNLLGYIN